MIFYTHCVKLHTECKSTIGVCKKTQCNKSLDGCKNNTFCVYRYTLSVKVHSVSVNCDFITLCIFAHTECIFTLSVYVY